MPYTVQAVGRCLRSVSPSMMSSCSSEKLCTNSTAAAAGTPRSGAPPAARADSSASAGRSALPAVPLRLSGCPSASVRPRWYEATTRTSGLSRPVAAAIAGPTRSRAVSTPAGIVAVMTATPRLTRLCYPRRRRRAGG